VPPKKDYKEIHRYDFDIDGVKIIVDFFKYVVYCGKCHGSFYRLDGSKINCTKCNGTGTSNEISYIRQYYTNVNKYNKYEENLGLDPRKIIIGVTKVTIDFLEKVNPRALHIDNLRMKKERGGVDYNRAPSKRNKINYYYLNKMLTSKWKILRGPEQIHIYQGDKLESHEIPFFGNFGVPFSYLKP
jgi:hypothetical protein